MVHIMTMLLSFYMSHTPNPNPRLELALEYLSSKTPCDPTEMPYGDVDANVYRILWKGQGPHCKENKYGRNG